MFATQYGKLYYQNDFKQYWFCGANE